MASHASAMLGTIPLTPTFSRNRSSAEGLLRLDFGSHGRWLQMRGETNWVNDLRMHQLRHLYQPDFKGTTSAKYDSYCVSQEEAEDCQPLFHHGSNRWTGRSHQSWRAKVAAKVGPEPPPGPAWMPGTQEQGFGTMSLAMLLFRSLVFKFYVMLKS